MRIHPALAVSGLALCLFLAAPSLAADNSVPAGNGQRVDANGKPTDHSTPAEHAATAQLNNEVAATDGQVKPDSQAAIDAQTDTNNAQYQQQQQHYQEQLQQHQAAVDEHARQQQRYEDRSAAYQALRDRYAAERAAYHRGVWPDRYVHWTLEENDPGLIGQRVEILNGDRVGTVVDVAHAPNGHVEALLVRLDSTKVVWVDQADIRYDRADGIVMTNLDRSDLGRMSDERG